MWFRKQVRPEKHKPDTAIRARRAEAEREYIAAQRQEIEADHAVGALEQTRLRNGFAPAIMAGIINNRGD